LAFLILAFYALFSPAALFISTYLVFHSRISRRHLTSTRSFLLFFGRALSTSFSLFYVLVSICSRSSSTDFSLSAWTLLVHVSAASCTYGSVVPISPIRDRRLRSPFLMTFLIPPVPLLPSRIQISSNHSLTVFLLILFALPSVSTFSFCLSSLTSFPWRCPHGHSSRSRLPLSVSLSRLVFCLRLRLVFCVRSSVSRLRYRLLLAVPSAGYMPSPGPSPLLELAG